VVTTNHRPLVTDTDHGTWRRLALVPFPHTYGNGDGDRTADGDLRSRLDEGREQQEAVLAWIVCRAQDWWVAGCRLPPLPDIVVHATQAWREEGEPLFPFIESRLTARPDGFASMQEMLEDFNDSLDRPHNPWGMVTFAQRLEGHPALKALGAVRGKHPRNRKSGSRGSSSPDHPPGCEECEDLPPTFLGQPHRRGRTAPCTPRRAPSRSVRAALRRAERQPERKRRRLAPADPKVGGGQGSCGEGW